VKSFLHRARGSKRSKNVGTAGPFTVAGFLPQADTESRFSGRVSDTGRSTSGRPGIRPASESLRRTNPRESGERWTVYGDLARQRRCWEMVL
jgi:hypothetical protein